MTKDNRDKLAQAIRRKGGNCTAAESFIPSMVDYIEALEAALAEARGALEECAADLEAEIEARRGAVLERTMERDLATVRQARSTLTKIASLLGEPE